MSFSVWLEFDDYKYYFERSPQVINQVFEHGVCLYPAIRNFFE